MPKPPYYPKDTAAYARDTQHLTLEEHGAYNLLMDLYWDLPGPLPLDETELLTLLRKTWGKVGPGQMISLQKTRKTWAVLQIFFEKKLSGFHLKRQDENLANYHRKSITNATNGGRGGRKTRQRTLERTPQPIKNKDLSIHTEVGNETRAGATSPDGFTAWTIGGVRYVVPPGKPEHEAAIIDLCQQFEIPTEGRTAFELAADLNGTLMRRQFQ